MAAEDRIIGPPGTGKTTALARALKWNADQVGPDLVIAISHTRAAAAELAGRDTTLPSGNVGTLHSFAFSALNHPAIIEGDRKALLAFNREHAAYQFASCRPVEDLEAGVAVQDRGEAMLAEYGRLRNMMLPRDQWPNMEVLAFAEVWESFKQDAGALDFTDLIEHALRDVDEAPQCPMVMAVDEAQDTSRLQWALVQKWAEPCERLITAGDPDQAIFTWAGADPDWFIENAPERKIVLEQSYRVPRAVVEVALPWIGQISNRDDVTYQARDAEGSVERPGITFRRANEVADLARELAERGTVMILASCAYMLRDVVAALRESGTPFANRYRRERGDWNPLSRRGEGSSVSALLAFLEPLQPGSPRLWTTEEARDWLGITTKVLRRGEKKKLTDWPNNLSGTQIVTRMAQTFNSHEDLSAAMDGDLDWFEAHVQHSRLNVVKFALHCVAQHGFAALQEDPKITVGTIHSVKGGEADSVIICPDLSYQGYGQWWSDGDRGRNDIVRQFYVGMTRARETLCICAPATNMAVMI